MMLAFFLSWHNIGTTIIIYLIICHLSMLNLSANR